MLKFSEIFEFSKEKIRKILILKEFEWFEWFEWFVPSPIEPFNPGRLRIFAVELLAPGPGQHAKRKEAIHARRAVEEQGLRIRAHL